MPIILWISEWFIDSYTHGLSYRLCPRGKNSERTEDVGALTVTSCISHCIPNISIDAPNKMKKSRSRRVDLDQLCSMMKSGFRPWSPTSTRVHLSNLRSGRNPPNVNPRFLSSSSSVAVVGCNLQDTSRLNYITFFVNDGKTTVIYYNTTSIEFLYHNHPIVALFQSSSPPFPTPPWTWRFLPLPILCSPEFCINQIGCFQKRQGSWHLPSALPCVF